MRQLEDEYLRDLPYLVDAMPTYLGICKPYRLTRDNIRRVPHRGIASPASPRKEERGEHYRDIYCGLHLRASENKSGSSRWSSLPTVADPTFSDEPPHDDVITSDRATQKSMTLPLRSVHHTGFLWASFACQEFVRSMTHRKPTCTAAASATAAASPTALPTGTVSTTASAPALEEGATGDLESGNSGPGSDNSGHGSSGGD
jgi:hypothetical protein